MSMAVAGVRGSQRLLLEYKCIMQNVISAESTCIGSLKRTFDFCKGSKWKVYETLWGN